MRSLKVLLRSCLMALPLVTSQLQPRRLNPRRVLIPDFTISFSPADPDLTTIEAKEVRDIAESLFENYLENFQWGARTLYDYAGLSGIEAVTLDDSTSPAVTAIKIRGGLVVFESSSTAVPSEDDIEAMLAESLYPSSSSEASLTDFLKITSKFGFVETSIYERGSYPSPPPSQAPLYSSTSPIHNSSMRPSSPLPPLPPTMPSPSPSFETTYSSMSPTKNKHQSSPLSFPPSAVLSHTPSLVSSILSSPTPSFKTDISKLEGDNLPPIDDNSSSSFSSGKLIAGSLAGGAVLAALAGLILRNRRGHQRQQVKWKTGTEHAFPPSDDADEAGLHKKDSLQDRGASADGKSEAGSSMLGRLLVAAAPPRALLLNNDSPQTTPQCSSNSEGSVDDFGATTIVPSILKLSSLESFEVDGRMHNMVERSLQKEKTKTVDPNIPIEWQSTPHIAMPYRSTLNPAEMASTVYFEKWSDCSSGQGDGDEQNFQHDVEANFAPDECWDFQDNEEDESDVMPFHTPAYPGFRESKKILLDETVERSSTMSPSNCFSV